MFFDSINLPSSSCLCVCHPPELSFDQRCVLCSNDELRCGDILRKRGHRCRESVVCSVCQTLGHSVEHVASTSTLYHQWRAAVVLQLRELHLAVTVPSGLGCRGRLDEWRGIVRGWAHHSCPRLAFLRSRCMPPQWTYLFAMQSSAFSRAAALWRSVPCQNSCF